MPSESCDCNTGAYGVTWPKMLCWSSFQSSWLRECNSAIDDTVCIMRNWCQWHHMTKKSYSISFWFCILIWLPWPKECGGATDDTWASCDTNASASGITWPKIMLHLILMFCTRGVQWCPWWHWFQRCYMTKKSCYTSFQSSCLKENNAPIDDTIGRMWCWSQYQWHHITEKVMVQLTSIVFS